MLLDVVSAASTVGAAAIAPAAPSAAHLARKPRRVVDPAWINGIGIDEG
jgi:hypothetical protein